MIYFGQKGGRFGKKGRRFGGSGGVLVKSGGVLVVGAFCNLYPELSVLTLTPFNKRILPRFLAAGVDRDWSECKDRQLWVEIF